MPVRPVVRLPEAVLKRVADPVTDIGPEEKALAADLLDTMFAAPSCVGVAAPQIGVSIRAFSVDVTGHKKADSCHGPIVLFNPVLVLARH
ncbi:MAG TPA: peptide deformylase, partial [Acidimicrobiia bacterium]|nr:peptide deformylase [Acidimicrobiia bacterium]